MKLCNIPKHFDASRKEDVYKVDYASLSETAKQYKADNGITNASTDKYKIGLMAIDEQNTFCIPGFELFVAGAPDDSVRLAEFIYKNSGNITKIFPTMDTHTKMQIFHPTFFIDDYGDHPAGGATMISTEEIKNGTWKINPAVASSLGVDYSVLTNHVLNYCESLEKKGKYKLTIWPYHAMLGGIGHALTSILEEAFFFHGEIRGTEPQIEIKGGNPLTENYSVLSPEVLETYNGKPIAHKNAKFINKLLEYDVLIIAGQAKSHCVAWTIDDLLSEIAVKDPSLAKKVYLLEDCTSPVVIPGVVDFTKEADQAFDKFKQAGMNVVKSTDPMDTWPGIKAKKLK